MIRRHEVTDQAWAEIAPLPPATVLASDQALTLEHVHRLACSHPRHAVGLRKGGLTRQRVALAVATLTDRLPELERWVAASWLLSWGVGGGT